MYTGGMNMKITARIVTLLMTVVLACAALTGCNILNFTKPASLEEYLNDPMMQKKLSIAAMTTKNLFGEGMEELAVYVEDDTKLVYDCRITDDISFGADAIAENINSDEFAASCEKNIKDVRNEVGDNSINFVYRYRYSSGEVFAEREISA